MTDYKKKQNAYKYGHFAETIASIYLRLKGYKILLKRYKTPVGEIDLIAKRKNSIIFVEVKARKGGNLDTALPTTAQQKRITNAALFFIANNPQFAKLATRFDVISLGDKNWPNHIQNAWMLD